MSSRLFIHCLKCRNVSIEVKSKKIVWNIIIYFMFQKWPLGFSFYFIFRLCTRRILRIFSQIKRLFLLMKIIYFMVIIHCISVVVNKSNDAYFKWHIRHMICRYVWKYVNKNIFHFWCAIRKKFKTYKYKLLQCCALNFSRTRAYWIVL